MSSHRNIGKCDDTSVVVIHMGLENLFKLSQTTITTERKLLLRWL